MYILDFYDILFFIKALKQPSDHFNIYHHTSFSTNNTRSASTNKLNPTHTNSNCFRNFYFNRLPRIWNKLPSIDLSLSLPTYYQNYYLQLSICQHFMEYFSSCNPCTFHFCCRCSNCYNTGSFSNFSTLYLIYFVIQLCN